MEAKTHDFIDIDAPPAWWPKACDASNVGHSGVEGDCKCDDCERDRYIWHRAESAIAEALQSRIDQGYLMVIEMNERTSRGGGIVVPEDVVVHVRRD